MTMTPLSKRLIVALVISVAMNLLIGGILAGSAIQRSRLRADREHALAGPRGRGHDGDRELAPRGERGERGPREGGRGARRGGAFGGLIAGHREEMVARQSAVATARGAVRDALTHEPFDRATLERALTGLRTETTTTQELLHKAILDAAQSGDAEARSKLARGFERPMAPPL
jgi:uncharacterized membrane protein